MHFSSLAVSALLLISGAAQTSAKALRFTPRSLRQKATHDDLMERTAFSLESELERRSTQTYSTSTPDTTMNTTIAAACSTAISSIANVTNAAGFVGCYNILQVDAAAGTFQADLRVYAMSTPTGAFADVATNMVLVMLRYPSSTSFKSMTKRDISEITRRQDSNSPAMIQQYSLSGSLTMPLDVSKLNDTVVASLMTPQISLQAMSPSTSQTVTANMTSSDVAYFVTGQFQDQSANAATVTNIAMANAVAGASQPFVLPGTTLGIFPTGLIITSAWTLLFFIAYGLGTIGRFRYREAYRRRKAAYTTKGFR